MKKGQVTAIDEMRVEVVAKYLNQLYKKIVEYLYGGRKNPEFMCMTGNTQRHHAGESTGWKDGGKNEMGIRGWTAGFQKKKSTAGGMSVLGSWSIRNWRMAVYLKTWICAAPLVLLVLIIHFATLIDINQTVAIGTPH